MKVTPPKASPSSAIAHSGHKRFRPRWGWSRKPAPTTVRKRATAFLAAVATKQAAAASAAAEATPTPTDITPITAAEASTATINWDTHTPPRPTTSTARATRSPAPSPSTAWVQPPEPALRAVLASRGIKRYQTKIELSRDEWAALGGEASPDGPYDEIHVSRKLWPEACVSPKDDCPVWAAGMRRGINPAAVAARTRAALRKAEEVMPTPPPTSPTPVVTSPVYQPASHPSSPVYQPASHPTSPSAPRTLAPALHIISTQPAPATAQYIEPPSPVAGVTRQRPGWTRPGGPLPPFLTAAEVPADFEEHRWNMAYVVHEVAGLDWHEECTCMDCDDTTLPRLTSVPKLWPGREVHNPFLEAYFNGR